MNLSLNIALLILGATATISAFGGKTWLEGEQPLLKRITLRGWVSLFCLSCALILGSLKEIVSAGANRELKRERDDAQLQVATANNKLDLLTKDLSSTRNQLFRETEINLLTVLANNNPVEAAGWELKLTGTYGAHDDTFEDLFSKIPPEFRDTAIGKVSMHPFLGMGASVQYSYKNDKLVQYYPDKEYQKRFVAPFTDLKRGDKETVFDISQKTTNETRYTSAAIAYRDLMEKKVIGKLSVRFVNEFRSGEKEKQLAQLKDEILRYWRNNFRGAHIWVKLRGPAHLILSCDVGISNAEQYGSEISITFRPTTDPKIAVGIIEF